LKNVIKFMCVIALTVITGFSTAACGGGGGLNGTYANEDLKEWTMTFSGSRVTNSFLGEVSVGTYDVEDDSITMTFNGESATSKYTLEGDKLRIMESGMTLSFIKK